MLSKIDENNIFIFRKGETMMNETFASVESSFNRIQNASKEDLVYIDCALDVLKAKLFY